MTNAITDDWGLTTADDTLHPPVDDDPWWTETVWFAFMVPERKLLGYFYPVFRQNLGVQAGGVLVFDDTAELPWELPIFDYSWHEPMPPGLDLRDMSLAGGLRLRALEPTRRWELGYSGRDLELDLVAEAVTKPLVTHASPPFNKGHIDQICRVTGTIVLHGETIAVDCLAMRDRSWGPRRDGRQPQVGYAYAASSADESFLAVAMGRRGDHFNSDITTGFLVRGGRWERMASGVRRIERDTQGRPSLLVIEGRDEAGREIHAIGEPVARQVFTAYPSMFCWNSLVRWEVDGAAYGWGEDQDCWHPRRWRDFRRAAR